MTRHRTDLSETKHSNLLELSYDVIKKKNMI